MWKVIFVLMITAAIIAIEWRSLMKRKHRGELWAFALLCMFGTGLGIAKALRLPIPNPLDWITVLYEPLSSLIYGSSQK